MLALLLIVAHGSPAGAQAQGLPEGPITTARGTVTIAGEVTATFGGPDDTAFFNYTDYEHNALRMFRVSLSGHVAPVDAAGLPRGTPIRGSRSASSLRALRPGPAVEGPRRSTSRSGRIPPVFGAFARRSYGADNPADRLSPRVSIPDVDPAGRRAVHRRRSAGRCGRAAGAPAIRSASHAPAPGRAAGQRVPLGHGRQASGGAGPRRGGRRDHERARCRIRAWRDDNDGTAGRRPASPGSRSSGW